MIINLSTQQFRQGLLKLCKIASLTSADSYTSHLKFTAKGKTFYGEAINETRTQTIAVKFDENSCSIQEPGTCCIPAKALQQTVELMIGETIELSTDKNVVNLRSLPYKQSDAIQSIEGLSDDQWIGMGKIETAQVIELHRDFFLDVGKFTANSCASDKSKAPLTAIHVNIFSDKTIQCTSTDYVRISLYDCKNGVQNGDVEENIMFMLPVEVAKKIPYIFDKNVDIIQAKIDSKKISLQSGNIIFGFSTEAGVENYPPLRSYLLDDMDVSCEIILNELIRIAGLLSAVAPKSPCNINFKSDQLCFDAQEGRNKSRQFLDIVINSKIELPQDIKIAIYDLVSSLSIPTEEKINMGLISIKNNSFGHLLELRQESDDILWRQIILKAREEIPEEEE